jgi:hypothetical protein
MVATLAGCGDAGIQVAADPDRLLEAATLSASDLGDGWRAVEARGSSTPDACAPSLAEAVSHTSPQVFALGADPATVLTVGAVTAVYPDAEAAEKVVRQFREADFSACLGGGAVATVEPVEDFSGAYVETSLDNGLAGQAALGVAVSRHGPAVSQVFVLTPADGLPRQTAQQVTAVLQRRLADA